MELFSLDVGETEEAVPNVAATLTVSTSVKANSCFSVRSGCVSGSLSQISSSEYYVRLQEFSFPD